jgi:hypothetical protein
MVIDKSEVAIMSIVVALSIVCAGIVLFAWSLCRVNAIHGPQPPVRVVPTHRKARGELRVGACPDCGLSMTYLTRTGEANRRYHSLDLCQFEQRRRMAQPTTSEVLQ